jgi:sialate O-acetylesterase
MRRILLLALACTAAGTAHAAVKLPALISDRMVLQQGMPVRIWGAADAGESVRVDFQGQSVSTKARENGKWEAWLRPLAVAGPLEMTIAASNTVTIKDVLVGEVWLGSGQSNMEWVMQNTVNGAEEISRANHPMIHVFHVKKVVADQPKDDVEGTWEICSPQSIPRFSAVEYFFGRHLQQVLHLPMGLIESDWGGTPAQSWTSMPALKADPSLKFVLDAWDTVLTNYPAAKQRYDTQLAAWNEAVTKARAENRTPPNRPPAPQGPGHPNTPAGLYNAMIAPLIPYAIRGVIWYQGESNASEAHAYRYRRLFADMIQDWRNNWGQGDFPFLFVQLANYQTNGWWPVLRESQTETLRLQNTGMAVTIDIGESKDIHPKNKQDVGKRLALAALHVAYQRPGEYSGPVYQQAVPEGGAMRVYFSHADGMQARGGGAVTGFTIAGADGNFVPAEAKLDGSTIVLSNSQVSAPVAVRYAWADDPLCNLTNSAGLPAGPFRSDQPYNN